MTQFPVPLAPAQQRRDCIVVDRRVYCRDEAVTAHDAGVLLLFIFILALWIGGGVVLGTTLDEKFNLPRVWPYVAAWYVVPSLTVIVILLWS